MNKSLFLFLFLFVSTHIYCQQYTLSGIVWKKNTKVLLPYATVVVINEDDSVVNAVISNSKGEFNMSLNQGSYILKINYMGYLPFAKKNVYST